MFNIIPITMKVTSQKFVFLVLLSLTPIVLNAQQSWQLVKGKITSPWAEKVDPNNVLPEYPRPQMERKGNWTNLNGLWQYAILPKSQQSIPSEWQGSILVPFCVESALSGVGKTVGKDSVLWYKRTIDLSPSKKQ
jgi:Glycosyl hydrolases family 2, sugar binding domain.